MSSDLAPRLRWNITVWNLLRASTRPVFAYPGAILSWDEVKEMRRCYEEGYAPEEFADLLIERDKSAGEQVRGQIGV